MEDLAFKEGGVTIHYLEKGGNTVSVFFMGLFSALILSPCVAPPLAAAILYIGQTSDFVLGGVSLLFMAIGMSVPLLILGFSSDYILPKPGIWMNFVKKIMGFVLLAMAAYIIRPRELYCSIRCLCFYRKRKFNNKWVCCHT